MEKLENYIELSLQTDSVIYSNSFQPISQILKLDLCGLKIKMLGLNEETEKKMFAVYPKDYPEEYIEFPVKYFKIVKKSKFVSLEHKHYLGNILSLGIKREILGDLIVKDSICYGVIVDNMYSFLKENLTRINSSPVELIEIEKEEVPKSEFKELNITIPSMRLDSLVSAVTNLSRTAAVTYIEEGNIQVNYEVQREKNLKLEIGDIFTIKKYGKFIVEEENGINKKNKMKICIKKYI